MSDAAKIESGAQLLARLGPRPSVHGLESAVPGFNLTPGDVVELYGREGVGKTELLLHLLTSTLLPPSRGQRGHCDNQAQVVWVDCDIKFSVLRLAVLLEQRIMTMMGNIEERGDTCGGDSETLGESGLKRWDSGVDGGGKNAGKVGERGDGSVGDCSLKRSCGDLHPSGESADSKDQHENQKSNEADSSYKHKMSSKRNSLPACSGLKRKACQMDDDKVSSEKLSPSLLVERSERCDEKEETRPPSGSIQSGGGDTQYEGLEHFSESTDSAKRSQQESVDSLPASCASLAATDRAEPDNTNVDLLPTSYAVTDRAEPDNAPGQLSGEDTERRVQECLERVQVARCTSSQQLLCTLHSLDAAMATNRNIVLLVIDSISAFFWSDRCKDLTSGPTSLLHKNMLHVADSVKKMAQSYGVLVAVSKQALIKARPKDGVFSPADGSRGDQHVEFLGKAWSDTVTQRCVCSKRVQGDRGAGLTRYTLAAAKGTKQFVISESGVYFDDD
ncbi:hypothetical protein V1264_005970 [Littorina saxatilis]|uniref:Rad51-like C-terminal domain-containing protein n=2 Tax=Littorina saxatilis TaxID=31220 RepID=A0AAN9G3R7_9CAEN